MADNTERFLERVTAGLATDPELRLDVQAELRAHLADKLVELGGEEHADEAVASLGEVVELAEEVAAANQRRLGARNLLRRVLRFGLVPASIVCAMLFSDISGFVTLYTMGPGREEAQRALRPVGWFGLLGPFARSAQPLFGPPRRQLPFLRWLDQRPPLTDHQRLLLVPDYDAAYGEVGRALWESEPANQAYYANYINCLRPNSPRLPLALEPAATVDPGNGRYPLYGAMYEADLAAELKDDRDADPSARYRLVVKDRPALDKAMADILAAVAMPHFHSHVMDLRREKAAILGAPTCLMDAVDTGNLAAMSAFPPPGPILDAERYSLAYARLLIEEGRATEAAPFLKVPEKLAHKLVPESFSLLDLMVVQIIAEQALKTVPKALREVGRQEEAAATETRLGNLLEPLRRLREEGKAKRNKLQPILTMRGEVGWPFVGDEMGPDEILARAAGFRRLQFTSVAESVASFLSLLLLVAMLVSLGISLRWRLSLGRQAAPLLLLPSWQDMLRWILLGIVVPLAGFQAWTRWVPFSGHAFSLGYAGHRAAAEFLVLGTVLILLPTWLALRDLRRRCVELDLPAPPAPRNVAYLPLVGAAVLLVAAFLVPPTMESAVQKGVALAGWGTALLGVFFLLMLPGLLRSAPAGSRTVGTLSRSLIPVFAAASLLLSVGLQPLLHSEERKLLRDRWNGMDKELGMSAEGLAYIQSFRDATLKAMAESSPP